MAHRSLLGPVQFQETAHPNGDLDLAAIVIALAKGGFDGTIRPDHGRMIWGETGTAGYGLFDRALGATYLRGILDGWEAALNERSHPASIPAITPRM